MQHIVYLSLGSNLGEKQKNIEKAIEKLNDNGIIISKKSSLYQTEPVDYSDQPEFFNQVIKCETLLQPKELLQLILNIENGIGRIRVGKGCPRIIDIDILLFDQMIIKQKDLTIPHPEMHKRNFVLIPLTEIESDLIHPVLHKKMSDLISGEKGRVEKI